MNLSDFREDYQRGGLDHPDLHANPLAQFEAWFREATGEASQSRWRKIGIALFKLWSAITNHRPADINAMTLATADRNGKPSSRTVLLKSVDERGFIFFTNYGSRKGSELSENPHAALTFFWSELERQVCVAGTVTRLPTAEAERYFKSRPRGSQIGAWASNQSEPVPNRAQLENKWRELEKQFPQEVPLPPNWGGFILRPERIEFWQGRPSRLHDRFCYLRQPDGGWRIERLSP
jgi:pyridoxamine 5'-phosphate oxidase